MNSPLTIDFPTARDQSHRRASAVRHLSPQERLLLAIDTLAAVEALSLASGHREQQIAWHRGIEEEGRQRMEAFIAQHVHK